MSHVMVCCMLSELRSEVIVHSVHTGGIVVCLNLNPLSHNVLITRGHILLDVTINDQNKHDKEAIVHYKQWQVKLPTNTGCLKIK